MDNFLNGYIFLSKLNIKQRSIFGIVCFGPRVSGRLVALGGDLWSVSLVLVIFVSHFSPEVFLYLHPLRELPCELTKKAILHNILIEQILKYEN